MPKKRANSSFVLPGFVRASHDAKKEELTIVLSTAEYSDEGKGFLDIAGSRYGSQDISAVLKPSEFGADSGSVKVKLSLFVDNRTAEDKAAAKMNAAAKKAQKASAPATMELDSK